MNFPHCQLIVYNIVFIALNVNSVRSKTSKIENYGYVKNMIFVCVKTCTTHKRK